MEKRISYSQFQQVKSAAKMIDPCTSKIESLKKKIMPLVEEMKGYQTQIDALEQGIVSVLGFHVAELVKKVIEPTGKTDANGKPIKVTKYLPTDIVSYDEQKKQYVIQIADNEETIVPPTTENVAGSDFDKDKEETSFQEPETTVEAEGEAVSELATEPANEQEAEAGDLPWSE
jgi:predicted transcriptional regulator